MEGEPPQRGPGKFASDRDEVLYTMSLIGWANASSGSVESPTGFFARISNATDDMGELVDALDEDAAALARPITKSLVGHFMLYEDDKGSVGVDVYPDQESLIADFERLDGEYSAWLMEQEG